MWWRARQGLEREREHHSREPSECGVTSGYDDVGAYDLGPGDGTIVCTCILLGAGDAGFRVWGR